MLKDRKNLKIKFLNMLFAIMLFLIYIILYKDIEENLEYNFETYKFALCWIGIGIYIYSIYSWYKINNTIFDLYTIMLTFFVLFNFGQCVLWAMGIHVEGEIGDVSLFGIGIPTDREIVLAQLVTLISIVMFNLGATFCYKNNKKSQGNVELTKNIILNSSKIMSLIVIPLTFLQLINSLIIRLQYGYQSLYYGEHMNSNLILEMCSRLFFVCLFGLLIGSDFKKGTRRFVYVTFFIYIVISLICGDRGGWIYALCIFAFLHCKYVKKFKFKSILSIFIIGIIILNIINGFVSLRNTEINKESIQKNFAVDKSPIVTVIAEMGGSMSIQTVLIMTGYDIYPYGNTYIFSILGIVSDRVIKSLGIEYVDLSTWFSKNFLGLTNWGTGFSIVGEALINFGPYKAPIMMLVLGWIISSLTYISNEELKNNPKKLMVVLIGALSLIPVFRGTMAYQLKIYFYRILVFYSMYLIFLTIYKNRKRGCIEI